MELREDAAGGAGLAAAAVAGDHADAAPVEQVREADVELAAAGGGEEVVGRDFLPEGMPREPERFPLCAQRSAIS